MGMGGNGGAFLLTSTLGAQLTGYDRHRRLVSHRA